MSLEIARHGRQLLCIHIALWLGQVKKKGAVVNALSCPFPTELYKQHLNDLEAFETNEIMPRAFLIFIKMGNTVTLQILLDLFL